MRSRNLNMIRTTHLFDHIQFFANTSKIIFLLSKKKLFDFRLIGLMNEKKPSIEWHAK